MFRHLIGRWKNWVGDADLERAIRDELVRQGYPRQASQLRDTRLYAIQRPGWVQVWSFRVETSRGNTVLSLFGAAHDDTRKTGPSATDVLISDNYGVVRKQLAAWSDGLIIRRR